MFVGHLAVALSAKRAEPRVSLGTWVAAAFGLDLLWPFFLLIGIEHVRIEPGNTAFTPLAFDDYPWSHSLMMATVWGAIAALILYPRVRARTGALLVGGAVISHWVLDWITHRPDLPLWPGGSKVGLGLWNSIPATLIIEGALLTVGVAFYVRRFPARDRVGRWGFWMFVAVMTTIWASGPWSPPPPTVRAIAIVGLLMPLFALWAHWVDGHRGRTP
jgi:hypothetical protein